MAPKIGSKVYNQQKQTVGRIVNIIGPVNHPYVLVRPMSRESTQQLQIIGEKVYILKEGKGRKKRN
jgi:rRNA processing protein Gar1